MKHQTNTMKYPPETDFRGLSKSYLAKRADEHLTKSMIFCVVSTLVTCVVFYAASRELWVVAVINSLLASLLWQRTGREAGRAMMFLDRSEDNA